MTKKKSCAVKENPREITTGEFLLRITVLMDELIETVADLVKINTAHLEYVSKRYDQSDMEKAAFLTGVKGELFKEVPGSEKYFEKVGEYLKKKGIIPPIKVTHVSRNQPKKKGGKK